MKNLSIKQQVNRIRKIYNQSTIEEIENGLTWYDDARAFCENNAKLFNIDVFIVAQLTSLFSPKKEWKQNKAEVVRFLKMKLKNIVPIKGFFVTRATMREAENILLSGATIPEHRIKTFSFAHNISYQDSKMVTIDRHAIKICFGKFDSKEILITAKRYKEAQKAHEILADELGIMPSQLQAIVWVTYKRLVNR
jgi:thermostable 8-oxoguanine DNA glycosylase